MQQGTGAPMVGPGSAERESSKPKGPGEALSPSTHSCSSLRHHPSRLYPWAPASFKEL